MSEGRLPTETWVMAHVRRCNGEGVPAMVVRRGDRQGGIVVLKINQIEAGCRVFTQTRGLDGDLAWLPALNGALRSEEHTSELQSLMRTSYAVFCLKKKTNHDNTTQN